MDKVTSHKQLQATARVRALLFLSVGIWIGNGRAGAQGPQELSRPGITYIDQPSGIDLDDYVAAWPNLASYVVRIRAGYRDAAKSELRHAIETGSSSDGALNLLGQLERQDGNLDESDRLVNKAIESNPRQPRHYFQRAMISFARLEKASGLGRWNWHRHTRDDYQRAFDLDPTPIPYRYYLVYSLAQTPRMAGGNKDQALRLADEGIALGQSVFYVVRADVHRLRGETAAAFIDYDTAISGSVFKLTSFLAAGGLALNNGDPSRAKRYFDWAVNCRPNDSRTHEALGDYYVAVRDSSSAAVAYREALRIDPRSNAARAKLAKLNS